ncbi:MAG: hypothetical protein ACPGOV_00565 [Magnetovibrionaceae bacterium]
MADITSNVSVSGKDTRTDEALLIEHLNRMADMRSNVFVVQVNLSQLRASNKQPQFLRIASRAFETIANNYDATVFSMTDADLILICREVPIDEVDNAIYKIRALFSEDPLTAAEEGSLEDAFSTWYDVGEDEDWQLFNSVAQDYLQRVAQRSKPGAKGMAAKKPEAPKEDARPGISPSNLAEINKKLKDTRIGDLIHQQPAVRVRTLQKGEVMFWEYFVSMAELSRRIAPELNLFGNRWLFQYLTETLDKRMLAIVAKRGPAALDEAISLNLNVGIIQSQDFQNFHRALSSATDKIVIELQFIDVFADYSTFEYTRDSLQDRGYRVLVDGLNPLTLQYFDPSHLKADYVKIAWGQEFMGDVPEDRVVEMRDVVEHTGREKVILSRVDSEAAVRWGIGLGISRFQGRFVDKLMEAINAKSRLRSQGGAKPPEKQQAKQQAQAPGTPPRKPEAKPRVVVRPKAAGNPAKPAGGSA